MYISLWQGLCLIGKGAGFWPAEDGIRSFLRASLFGCLLLRTPGLHTVLIMMGQRTSIASEVMKLSSSSQCLPQPTSSFPSCSCKLLLLQKLILFSSGIAEQWPVVKETCPVESPAQFGAVTCCDSLDAVREEGQEPSMHFS